MEIFSLAGFVLNQKMQGIQGVEVKNADLLLVGIMTLNQESVKASNIWDVVEIAIAG
ncbi:unnamed protein product [Meloidogyne enterolobii]|uniref:Uncharacterized protein n=1 Tax=Meloidogyne enterolobii TaxID=390850 RepID=A0ACB1AWG6_MELEN